MLRWSSCRIFDHFLQMKAERNACSHGRLFRLYPALKPPLMKNEPVVTYNHMEEDDAGRTVYPEAQAKESLPISLYMLLVVDAILVSAIVFLTFKVIF